jgi:hypothetical protein
VTFNTDSFKRLWYINVIYKFSHFMIIFQQVCFELANCDVSVTSRMFADDSKCFRVILGQDDGNALQNDLDRLLDWTKTWGMEFNFLQNSL